ncbi:TPA: methylation-associated defense system helix-turn-helix domain-containing protein MAD1 [Yersinia enterocolitica]|nr:DNA-binding protein [Yersinia enterocolitica]HDW8049944.1 helix-turn-helix domain-containing protein [Yersinia enterocolitica]HEB0976175.1 helix-turn-helix domain-containing protein [Yersinia enterocolitica]
MVDNVLTIKEVAEYFKVNERTVYRLAAANKIPAFKVGNAWRFKQSDIEEWINIQAAQGKGTVNGNN